MNLECASDSLEGLFRRGWLAGPSLRVADSLAQGQACESAFLTSPWVMLTLNSPDVGDGEKAT